MWTRVRVQNPLGAADTGGVSTHLQALLPGSQSPAHERNRGQSRRKSHTFLSVTGLEERSGYCCKKNMKPCCNLSLENKP